MNSSFKLNAPWQTVRERMKESNINLTDEDLKYEPGAEDELLDPLEKKLRIPKDNLRMWIESISFNSERAG